MLLFGCAGSPKGSPHFCCYGFYYAPRRSKIFHPHGFAMLNWAISPLGN
jgi:hypothetical protein